MESFWADEVKQQAAINTARRRSRISSRVFSNFNYEVRIENGHENKEKINARWQAPFQIERGERKQSRMQEREASKNRYKSNRYIYNHYKHNDYFCDDYKHNDNTYMPKSMAIA